MAVVLEVARRITVMDRGAIIAEGTPEEIETGSRSSAGVFGNVMLRLERINCFYGAVHVLKDVSLRVESGEIVGLLGRNGAGKTTTLKTILGLVKPRSGRIELDGSELTRLRAHDIPAAGHRVCAPGSGAVPPTQRGGELAYGPAGKGQRPQDARSCSEPLSRTDRAAAPASRDPERGEQQMLATARALCLEPKLLLLDEPSEGLMPSVVETLLETIVGLKEHGVSALLVEQKVEAALKVADRITFLENGAFQREATPEELSADPKLLHRYVGVRR